MNTVFSSIIWLRASRKCRKTNSVFGVLHPNLALVLFAIGRSLTLPNSFLEQLPILSWLQLYESELA